MSDIFNTRTFRFESIYHPYVWELVSRLNRGGVPAVMAAESQGLGESSTWFETTYEPNADILINDVPIPRPAVDFAQGPYEKYNWELFFHIPMYVAARLRSQRQYAEALKWLRYVLDPTAQPDGDDSAKWQFLPFRGSPDASNQAVGARLEEAVDTWRRIPFAPFAIGRFRQVAFQRWASAAYVENLVAWGDDLFHEDTFESINEATLLYVSAARLLGVRPREVAEIRMPDGSPTSTPTVGTLIAESLHIEVEIEAFLGIKPRGKSTVSVRNHPTYSSFNAYFCIPANERVERLHDLVADRLYKIRNSMNIQGVLRRLPFFAPPIDPGLLVRAKAAGLSIDQVIAAPNPSSGQFRFQSLLNRAIDFCQDLRGLGQQLLATLEKRDGERLAALRQTLEREFQERMRDARQLACDEADAQIRVLEAQLVTATRRKNHYVKLLGLSGAIEGEPPSYATNTQEQAHLTSSDEARSEESSAAFFNMSAAIFGAYPNVTFGVNGAGGSPSFNTAVGGSTLALIENLRGQVHTSKAASLRHRASQQLTIAGYVRRSEEWGLQVRLADGEIQALERQQIAAEIRKDIAERERLNLERQIADTQTLETFLDGKFTNTQLYDWMVTKTNELHAEAYRLAHAMARDAANALTRELGVDGPAVVLREWSADKLGLLAGDHLLGELRRMQERYIREFPLELELEKTISLREFNPEILLRLRFGDGNSVSFSLPEVLFDADHPTHFYRRIRSVEVSVPVQGGAAAGVHGSLSLSSSQLRTAGGEPTDLAAQSRPVRTSIALSTGMNDTGLTIGDGGAERYFPFEFGGAISTWTLTLPQGSNRIRIEDLQDVVLRIRYTARDDGSGGRLPAAINALYKTPTVPSSNDPLAYLGRRRLIDVRDEMPEVWAQFQDGAASLEVPITAEHFARMPQLLQPKMVGVEVILVGGDASEVECTTPTIAEPPPSLDGTTGAFGVDSATSFKFVTAQDPSTITLNVSSVTGRTNVGRLLLLVHYKGV